MPQSFQVGGLTLYGSHSSQFVAKIFAVLSAPSIVLCVAEKKQVGGVKDETLVLTGTATDASGRGKEEIKSKEETASSKPDSKAAMTNEEKMKLLSLYGCESDEDEYP